MIIEIFKRALDSLARNRTRTALTLIGISWGVACFVILFAYGDGFNKAIGLIAAAKRRQEGIVSQQREIAVSINDIPSLL